jgi:hypothetical protein
LISACGPTPAPQQATTQPTPTNPTSRGRISLMVSGIRRKAAYEKIVVAFKRNILTSRCNCCTSRA